MSGAPPPSLEALDRAWPGLLFPREAGPLPGVDEERRALYRRLVRNHLLATVRQATPIAQALLGPACVDELVAAWLDEAPPQVRLLREITTAFGAWAVARTDLPHPPAGELLHWETLELEVLQAPDAAGPAPEPEPDDARTIEPDPSARLAAYRHPVHRLAEGAAWPAAAAAPVLLLAHRVDEAREVVELSPLAARLLARTAEGATIGAALAALEAEAPGLDRPAAHALLRDLRRRGALRGFPALAGAPAGR